MLTYKTRDCDVLDQIIWRQYGVVNSAMILQVFDANPRLSSLDAVLPAGVEVLLPDIQQPAAETTSVSLWD